MNSDVETIEEYLDNIPKERQKALKEVINVIREAAPDITGELNHGMPFFPLEGEPLFAVASQKKYMAIYITERDILNKHKRALGDVEFGTNCIRFNQLDDLNLDALKELVEEAYNRRLEN